MHLVQQNLNIKNKKMKQILSRSAFFILFIIVIAGCKKEKTTIQNNPNIFYFEVNKTLVYNNPTNRIDSINLDNTGAADILFTIVATDQQQSAIIYLQDDPANGFVKDTTISGVSFAKPLNKDVSVNISNNFVLGFDGTAMHHTSYPIDRGIAGQGDRYFGFKVKLADGLHFGWLLVNYDRINNELSIKQIAYNKVLNASIKTGEK
jgi:hypothetical protein